jgi:type II secretory pathway pseudopilin PulG
MKRRDNSISGALMNEKKARTRKGFTPLEMNRRRKFLTGFTLVEIMFAVALFGAALFGILKLINGSIELNQLSGSRTIAMNDARRVLEEMRTVVNANGTPGITGTDWGAWAGQNIAFALANENIVITYPQGAGLNPLPVQATVNWSEKGRASAYSVETHFTQR